MSTQLVDSASAHAPVRARARRRAISFAGLALSPLVLIASARWLAHDRLLPLVWLNSVTPLLYLPAYVVLAFAVRHKRVALGVGAALVVVSHLVWVAPSLVAERTAAPGPRLRVVTANLLAVNPDTAPLLEELRSSDADVMILEEVSPRWASALRSMTAYPHRHVEVSGDAFGIAILSRRPLRSAHVVDLHGVPMIDAEVEHDGRIVRVLGVHTLPPYSSEYAAVWRAQLHTLATMAERTSGPVIVAGDLNATTHHAGMRALEEAGLEDVHELRGRGLATTWPNGVFPLPPLRLDHVLVSRALSPVAVREGVGEGSDHRPVVVDLAFR